jgi:hypothetical protein
MFTGYLVAIILAAAAIGLIRVDGHRSLHR